MNISNIYFLKFILCERVEKDLQKKELKIWTKYVRGGVYIYNV